MKRLNNDRIVVLGGSSRDALPERVGQHLTESRQIRSGNIMEKTLSDIRRMWRHVFWADGDLLKAVSVSDSIPDDAIREFAHIIGTEEVWLARLEGRPPRLAVWPSDPDGDLRTHLHAVVRQTHGRWESYLSRLQDSVFDKAITYTNSAGRTFENTVRDILLHVVLHGQYHRGKVNLMLRQAGSEPAPVDYIALVRGAPAATEADARRCTS